MTRIHSLKKIVLALCVSLIAMFSPNLLVAQVDTGGVTGTVTDTTGAAVVNAQITLTNPATGISQNARSTSTGTYSFSGVRTGTYDLKAEAPGFQTFTSAAISAPALTRLRVGSGEGFHHFSSHGHAVSMRCFDLFLKSDLR